MKPLIKLTKMFTYIFLHNKSNNNFIRKYFPLKFDIRFIYFFPLPWTIVHPIDEDSPLYGKTAEDLEMLEAELLIMIKGFDDSFSQQVIARSSYKYDEIEWDVKFIRAHTTNDSGETIVNLEKIGETESIGGN